MGELSLQAQIDADLKTALLAGDKDKVTVLRGLKSALLYEAVAQGVRDAGLSEEWAEKVLVREAKKRQEAADIYEKAGETARYEKELGEKGVIDHYLPEKLSDDEVSGIIKEELAKHDAPTMKDMGAIIGAVRQRAGGQADGAMIAKMVRDSLEK